MLAAAPSPAAQGGPPLATIAPEVVTLPVEIGRDIRFRRTVLEQGLSQTRVSHIVQDDRGFLWFGTQHGLNRFDGREYRLFKHEAGDPGSLSGVFIYALFKDRSGTLWVGSDQGLDAYDAGTETFRHVRVDVDDPVVIQVSQDKGGILWLATAQGLYRLDPATGRTRRFVHDPSDPTSLASNDVKSSGLDRKGEFWVATGEGLEAFDPKSGRVTLRIPLQVPVREFTFHEDRTGAFWIVYGSGNGLAQLDRATNTVTRFAFQGGETGGSGLTGVYAILEAEDGTLWLGTMGGGLLRFDRERHAFVAYRNVPEDPESLAENRVIALFEDSQANIWVGLHASPPNAFTAAKLAFERVVTPSYDPKAAGETLVNTVYNESRGVLWVGAGGALGRIDRATGEKRAIAPPGGGPVEVLTIRDPPPGALWFGTLGRGLWRLNLGSGDMTSYRRAPDDPESLSSDIVTRIFVDRGGTMWLATWNGLDRFDPGSGRSKTFKRNPQSAAEGYFSIAEDPTGDLWLGSTTGLFRFTPTTGAFQAYLHKSDEPESLSNNTVNTVLVDTQGALWVGTQNGLNVFDRKRGTFRTFGKRDGLPGDVVSCVLEDKFGDLWMSTNNGMARLDRAALTFTSFSVADGLPGNDLSGWNACDKAPSGEMAFGGFSGAAVFRPEDVSEAETQPPVLITEVRVDGSPSPPGQINPAEGHETAVVDLASGRELVVSYAALYFRAPSVVRYRYRLHGLDPNWREVSSDRRVASFTALPAGAYRFEVEATTGRGGWTEPAATVMINVLPPWWQSWWFRVSTIALVAAAAFAAYRIRVREMGRQYAIRLDERLNERSRIARELHDSLLQGFQALIFRLQAIRNMLPDRPEESARLLDVALDRADAAVAEGRSAVSELRTTAASDQDLARLLAGLGDEFRRDHGPGPRFELLIEGRPQPVGPLIRDEIFLVAREAVRNAVKHASASRIEVELSFGRKDLIVRVRDDGVGLDDTVVAAGAREGHWGLPGMRERAASIGGRLTIWSRSGAGVEIELVVPVVLAYARAAGSEGREGKAR